MALWYIFALLPIALAHMPPAEEYFDILKLDQKDWRLAFRGTAGIERSLYDAYINHMDIPDTMEEACMNTNWTDVCTHHYRNNDALENWVGVQDVLVGLVHDGALVKTLMFNGTKTGIMDWFSQEKLLSDCYPDLKDEPKNYFSVDGWTSSRSERRFYISRNHGGCDADAGWMVVMDTADRNCAWEQSSKKFPLIRYSSDLNVVNWRQDYPVVKDADALVIFIRYIENRGERTEYHDVLNTGVKDYRLAFRASSNIGVPMYPAYVNGSGIVEPVPEDCKSMNFSLPCNSHYYNTDAMEKWEDIEEVLVGIADESGALVKYLIFHGENTTKFDFFSQEKLKFSCWRDLPGQVKNFFSIEGDTTTGTGNVRRRFFINHVYAGCPGDEGWLVIVDNVDQTTIPCAWERKTPVVNTPRIMFNNSPRVQNYNTINMKDATALVVMLKYRN